MSSDPSKLVKAFQYKADTRVYIPSDEDAGYEKDSPKVQAEQTPREFPRNPVTTRGQDPELFWMNKYGASDSESHTSVDLRSLYRHEHIAPEALIKNFYRLVATENNEQPDLGFSRADLFGNVITHEEIDKVGDYYRHSDNWLNRLIQSDSLLAMTSLLEREGMASSVQCIYFDPPYGIRYGSNWQIRLNNRTVSDGQDDSLTGEPEQIKAFRDTWELGIHSYLSYLRDRLLVARELLHDSGSCFLQISDENVHLVRCLMDEVFGSGNFCSLITFQKTSGSSSLTLPTTSDYLIWYAKDKERMKMRKLYKKQRPGEEGALEYKRVELLDGSLLPISKFYDSDGVLNLPDGARIFATDSIVSQGGDDPDVSLAWGGKQFVLSCKPNRHWKPGVEGIKNLWEKGRLLRQAGLRIYKRYFDDFPYRELTHVWDDTRGAADDYVVQTTTKVIERCILMTTDPGDLVLDPTCGSGTTAYVAEQWGRRWITCDTSRIAINIAKSRLMTATFPYYQLHDVAGGDLRQGFAYNKVKHITLGSIANNEPPETETLYDQPIEDKKRLRVASSFTVETLQSYEPISPEELARQREESEELAPFEDLIFAHLQSAGVKTGDKAENAVFTRVDRLADAALHAEGWYGAAGGVEKKAYLHIGPKFGAVSKQAVGEAIRACRDRRDGDWLLILGFAFEGGLQDVTTRSFGSFQVSIVRMHDDLLQTGLLKKDKKAASFVTIGEPDIRLQPEADGMAKVEIAGLDIYDPIRDEVKSRDVHDIAYWMLDDAYDGSNFLVRQAFFCGGSKDEFAAWKSGLTRLAEAAARKKTEQTLKLQIDEEAFAGIYGHISRPFTVKAGQKVAVRVVSQFGEETTKILTVP